MGTVRTQTNGSKWSQKSARVGGWRSGTRDARTPDHLRVEFDDSAPIASCPTSVPMGLAASEIVSASPRPGDAARARLCANWRG